MNEKLKEIYEMVDTITTHGDDPEMIDTVTKCQCELPNKLNEVRDYLLSLTD